MLTNNELINACTTVYNAKSAQEILNDYAVKWCNECNDRELFTSSDYIGAYSFDEVIAITRNIIKIVIRQWISPCESSCFYYYVDIITGEELEDYEEER